MIGPTNAGKSALVAALTGAAAVVSPIPNTTWEPMPAMMPVENTEVQLVDTPPLSREYVEPRLKELIRHSDLVLLVVDLEQDPVGQLLETAGLLEEYRIAPPQRRERYANELPAYTFLPFLVLVNKCDDAADEEAVHDLLRAAG